MSVTLPSTTIGLCVLSSRVFLFRSCSSFSGREPVVGAEAHRGFALKIFDFRERLTRLTLIGMKGLMNSLNRGRRLRALCKSRERGIAAGLLFERSISIDDSIPKNSKISLQVSFARDLRSSWNTKKKFSGEN